MLGGRPVKAAEEEKIGGETSVIDLRYPQKDKVHCKCEITKKYLNISSF